jgi:hypothetical protein
MGVPTSEVGYTSTTTVKGDHEVHKGEEKKEYNFPIIRAYLTDEANVHY